MTFAPSNPPDRRNSVAWAQEPAAEILLALTQTLPFARLAKLTHDGRTFFVKRVEREMSTRMRLMKGDPLRALAREARLLRDFALRGARVARVVAAEPGCLILADHGTPLSHLIHRGDASPVLLQAAGAALGHLHALGLAHGRPAARDICWDGAQMTLIDLEGGARLEARPRHQARDLFILLHSVCVETEHRVEAAREVLAGYRATGQSVVLARLAALARSAAPLEWLSRPIGLHHQRRGKTRSEFAAFAPTRRFILQELT